MKASQVLAAGALVAPALAQNRTEIVTITDTAYTTYCPVPTTIPIGNMTYTVSKATTLTITNCPCTLTKTGWFKPTATPTAQPGGCDEKTGAGCPADQTPTGAQPTGTSVVVAGANVNGLSAGAMVVAGFAAMML
ncbi:hypothetical protein MHUMG1_05671 [Metarhizium humberi]|uniref:Clock-controlled protein 6 n=1 Tax=Metarhizium humberi TaxID=2596975 RepID=A0A9P8S7P0_9HYPO|nr:hypothetical protein MHUMG1_05671 [Metarhizium humberi]